MNNVYQTQNYAYRLAVPLVLRVRNKRNKAISVMRGKSPLSELILEIIKSNNSFKFFKTILEREIILFFVEILFCLISSHLFN